MKTPSTSYNPPDPELVHKIIAPFKAYFSPKIFGLDKIDPNKPALYVSNHSVFGLTDGFFLGAEMYEHKGVMMRALVDNLHMEVPVWRKIIHDFGMMPASRETCARLMKEKQHIIVFPGGKRETTKHKDEQYHLIWKNRHGFVKMAIQFGYDIIPVASIGGEEMYKILMDATDIMRSPLGLWLQKSGFADRYLKGGDEIWPIARGVGPTIIPKPERIYIKIGDRISTEKFHEDFHDENVLHNFREEIEAQLYNMFEELKEIRENDTDEEWWRKFLKKL